MHNSDTTIGENVSYCMYKCKIVYDDWFNDLSNIFNTIDALPNRFLVGEQYFDDPNKILNAFNSYFINIGPSGARHIVTDVSYKDNLSENHTTTIKINFVREEAVDSIINKLKIKLVEELMEPQTRF